jgi:hypothetical protein
MRGGSCYVKQGNPCARGFDFTDDQLSKLCSAEAQGRLCPDVEVLEATTVRFNSCGVYVHILPELRLCAEGSGGEPNASEGLEILHPVLFTSCI